MAEIRSNTFKSVVKCWLNHESFMVLMEELESDIKGSVYVNTSITLKNLGFQVNLLLHPKLSHFVCTQLTMVDC